MDALVSLVDEKHYNLVVELWDELEQACGLKGVRVTPFPHFSWSVAQSYFDVELEKIVGMIASSVRPFKVRTAGVGMFTGDKPVVYLPVVKTVELMRYHGLIWQLTAPVSRERSRYYSPENWMPHITLAYDDITTRNIGPVMERLAFRSFDWEFTVDNIALIHHLTGAKAELKHKYQFTASVNLP